MSPELGPVPESLTFGYVAWAALLNNTAGDEQYLRLYRKSDLRKRLVESPSQVPVEEVESSVCSFLSHYGMRRKYDPSALRNALQDVSGHLRQLENRRLEAMDFTEEVRRTIQCVFDKLRSNMPNLGPTGTSKVLGMLNPPLFVMWDGEIAKEYYCGGVAKLSGEHYAGFLTHMSKLAKSVLDDYARMRAGDRDPAGFLSRALDIDPALPLAKFLDVYNWEKITKKRSIPPQWHPCEVR